MSPLLLRAVGPADRESGLGAGEEVTFVSAGRIGVWVSRFDARPELGRAEMLEHHRLVEAICAAGACLPVRLGTWAESKAEARGLLAAREEALLGALARVEGKVEVAVSFLWREGGGDVRAPGHGDVGTRGHGGAGTQYLRRRQSEIARREEREARGAELARLVEGAVGVTGRDAQHRVCPSEAVALSSALLVGRAGAEAALAALGAAASGLSDVEVVVNGPWPPYSFAGIG